MDAAANVDFLAEPRIVLEPMSPPGSMKFTADGPRITDEFASTLRVSGDVQQQIDEILRSVHSQYLALESNHVEQSTNETGHQITVVAGFPSAVEPLEHKLWSQLDELLDVEQQGTARINLKIYAPSTRTPSGQTNSNNIQGVLGWGPSGSIISI